LITAGLPWQRDSTRRTAVLKAGGLKRGTGKPGNPRAGTRLSTILDEVVRVVREAPKTVSARENGAVRVAQKKRKKRPGGGEK